MAGRRLRIERIADARLREVSGGAPPSRWGTLRCALQQLLACGLATSELHSLTVQSVFTKRKNGLLRRAMELSVLCDCEVAVVVFGPDGKLAQYSSCPMDQMLRRYGEACSEPHETHTTQEVRCCILLRAGARSGDQVWGPGLGTSSGGRPPQHALLALEASIWTTIRTSAPPWPPLVPVQLYQHHVVDQLAAAPAAADAPPAAKRARTLPHVIAAAGQANGPCRAAGKEELGPGGPSAAGKKGAEGDKAREGADAEQAGEEATALFELAQELAPLSPRRWAARLHNCTSAQRYWSMLWLCPSPYIHTRQQSLLLLPLLWLSCKVLTEEASWSLCSAGAFERISREFDRLITAYRDEEELATALEATQAEAEKAAAGAHASQGWHSRLLV